MKKTLKYHIYIHVVIVCFLLFVSPKIYIAMYSRIYIYIHAYIFMHIYIYMCEYIAIYILGDTNNKKQTNKKEVI